MSEAGEEEKPVTQAEAKEMLQTAKDAMADMKRQISEAKTSLAAYAQAMGEDPQDKAGLERAKVEYQKSLKVTVIDNPKAPGAKALMKQMYGLYEKVFPIEEEREELDKLNSLMEKNHDKKLQDSGAPFREQWIIVQDDKGQVVAARNTITFSAAKDEKVSSQVDGTQHLIYGFVDPAFRSMGLGDFTMGLAEDNARKFISSTLPGKRSPDSVDFIQISEQNAPLKMTMGSMLLDTAGAKTDQFWRREYYESLGFRELDFNYVQLPLQPRSEGGEPSRELNLIIRGVPAPKGGRGIEAVMTSAPAAGVGFHLYNFFDRSVAAGAYEVDSDPDWVAQAAELNKATLDVKPKLDFNALKGQTWDFMEKYIKGSKFSSDDFSGTQVGEMIGVTEIPLQMAKPAASADLKSAPKPAANG